MNTIYITIFFKDSSVDEIIRDTCARTPKDFYQTIRDDDFLVIGDYVYNLSHIRIIRVNKLVLLGE